MSFNRFLSYHHSSSLGGLDHHVFVVFFFQSLYFFHSRFGISWIRIACCPFGPKLTRFAVICKLVTFPVWRVVSSSPPTKSLCSPSNYGEEYCLTLWHYGPEQKKKRSKNSQLNIHFPASSGVSEQAYEWASGPVLTSRFLVILDHITW